MCSFKFFKKIDIQLINSDLASNCPISYILNLCPSGQFLAELCLVMLQYEQHPEVGIQLFLEVRLV